MRPQKVGKVLVEKETITIEQNLRVIRDSKRGKKCRWEVVVVLMAIVFHRART